MTLTLVRPGLSDRRQADALPPLAFAILKGLTPPDIQVRFYDDRTEKVPFKQPTDLVALSVETFTAKRAYAIADHYRSKGVKVVMGGYHPSFLPQEALEHADAVVLGDAEGAWQRLLDHAIKGQLQPRYQQSPQEQAGGLANIPFDRSIFGGKGYSRVLPVQFSRGCRYACDFCSIHAFYGLSLRHRPVEEVVEEIRHSGTRFVLIVDDNIFINKPQAMALFEALIPLKIHWGCQVSIDVAFDPDLLDLMARSGCTVALVGFETLNPDSLKQMKKGWNLKRGTYPQAIQNFHRHGIMLYGSFVFGYDHDTQETFASTAAFAINAGLALVNFSVLTPTPGSALYERLEQEQRLLYPKWWLADAYRYGQAVYQPAQMSPQTLTDGAIWARQQFYGWSSLWKRLLNQANRQSPTHLGLYWLMNHISRKELRAKLGQPLGGAV